MLFQKPYSRWHRAGDVAVFGLVHPETEGQSLSASKPRTYRVKRAENSGGH